MYFPLISSKTKKPRQGQGLEDALLKIKDLDYQIAESLYDNCGSGWKGYVANWPIIGRIMKKVSAIQPLGSLESQLREGLNNSLASLVDIGIKAREEEERIQELERIYATAQEENWQPHDFMSFIEQNTDLNFTVTTVKGAVDLKELFYEIDARLPEGKVEEKIKDNLDWIAEHIDYSKNYLQSIHAITYIGSEWIQKMSRTYFNLTQLRSGMEQIQITMSRLSGGGQSTSTTEQALRDYGVEYVNGMRALVKEYNEINRLKSQGSKDFSGALEQLKLELNSPSQKSLPKNGDRSRKLSYTKKEPKSKE